MNAITSFIQNISAEENTPNTVPHDFTVVDVQPSLAHDPKASGGVSGLVQGQIVDIGGLICDLIVPDNTVTLQHMEHHQMHYTYYQLHCHSDTFFCDSSKIIYDANKQKCNGSQLCSISE